MYMKLMVTYIFIQLFQLTLSYQSLKLIRLDQIVVWVFIGISAYWATGNKQVCIFANEEFVFPFRSPFSVALHSLSHGFEF